MGKNLENKRIKIRRRKINILLMMVAALGALLCLYLWNVHLSDNGQVICVTDGCDATLKGEYSVLLGVPVAAMGFAFYFAAIVLAFLRSKIQDLLLDKLLYIHVILGVIFTLYLRYIEFVKIGDICPWCWGSVLFVVLMVVLTVLDARLSKNLKS